MIKYKCSCFEDIKAKKEAEYPSLDVTIFCPTSVMVGIYFSHGNEKKFIEQEFKKIDFAHCPMCGAKTEWIEEPKEDLVLR